MRRSADGYVRAGNGTKSTPDSVGALPPPVSRRGAAALVGMALVVGGCSDAPIGPADEGPIGSHEAAIINGTPDTTNQGVVAWLKNSSKCSATIIEVQGNIGYALTAGHCIPGGNGTIYQGNNHNNPVATYTVIDREAHPDYDISDAYDFGMVTFTGANGSTPVIPALQPGQDNINVGTQLDLVGYGQTESGGTSVRHHKVMPVDDASPLLLRFDQSTGGICSGDSGGGALHSAGGTKVAGVHSFGTQGNCAGFGFSVRVSAVYDTFIRPYIDGTPYQPQTCDQCLDAHAQLGLCGGALQACFESQACIDYINCVNGCTSNACVVQCDQQHASGKAMLDAHSACQCDDACAAECADDSACDDPPACYVETSPDCQGCLDTACCAEATACAADENCDDCLDTVAGCPNDPLFTALSACLENNCGSGCSLGSTSSSSSTTATGAGGATAGPGTTGVGGAATSTTGSGGNSSDDDDGTVVEQGGCACSTPASGGDHRHALLGLGLVLALALRRRRR